MSYSAKFIHGFIMKYALFHVHRSARCLVMIMSHNKCKLTFWWRDYKRFKTKLNCCFFLYLTKFAGLLFFEFQQR